MNISQINNVNYNDVNFKSKIVPTKYISDLLDSGIKNPRGCRTIADGLHRVLNDGKNNLVKIDYDKNKFWQLLFPGSYSIKINDGNIFSNTHFVGRGINIQGQFALKEVYRDSYGNIHLPQITEIEPLKKLNSLMKRVVDKQNEIFNEYDYGTADIKKIKKLKKNLNFLKSKYDDAIRQELINLKNIIFSNPNI